MSIIQLTPWHLGMASLLVFLLALLSYKNNLQVEKPLLVAFACGPCS
jgi:ABC-type iron transport system FetAB permease component